MTAKEYLEQIELMDTKINNKLVELYQLRCLTTSITAPTDKEAVQTSGNKDKIGSIVAKIVDLENEINSMIDDFITIKQGCISTIEKINNPLLYNILHKHYVQYKSLVEIANEENYSYQYIVEAHGSALKAVKNNL